jgi:hypothetical protein
LSESFEYFGGIDFSGAKEPLSNLWTALAHEEEGRLVIDSLRPHAFRADLGAFVRTGWREVAGAASSARILWGADFPFSLPAPAAAHLCGPTAPWSALVAWAADRPADEIRDAVPDEMRTPRAADTDGAVPPLDVRNYRQTVEGMRWLHDLREEGDVSVRPQEPQPDATVTLVEVLPAATVHEMGLPRRRAPSRPGEARARAAALRTFLRFSDPTHEAIAVVIEDAWDATLACLTAWLARDDLDQPSRISTVAPDRLAVEGWIYRAPSTL